MQSQRKASGRAKKIDRKILRILNKHNIPLHTEFIAQKTSLSWNTVQAHADNLASLGKIKRTRMGKVNLWWV